MTATVTGTSPGALGGTVTAEVPAGWSVEPRTQRFHIDSAGELLSEKLDFELTVPADAVLREHAVEFTATGGDFEAADTVAVIVSNPVDLSTGPEADLLGRETSRLAVTVTNNLDHPTIATVRLETPQLWAVEPSEELVALEPGESKTVGFSVTPPEGSFGETILAVVAEGEGEWPTTRVELPATVSRPVVVIGSIDQSSGEFALSPDGFGQYPSAFPNDVDLTADQDDPTSEWSYIHLRLPAAIPRSSANHWR